MDVWGFAIKPFAYMASSFQNAMLIDADIIFLKSPTEIFKSNLFIETGALFFRDRTLKSYEELQKNMDLLLNNYFPRPLSKEILDNRMVNGILYLKPRPFSPSTRIRCCFSRQEKKFCWNVIHMPP